MDLTKLSLKEIQDLYKKGSLKPVDLVRAYKKAMAEQADLNAVLEVFDDAEEKALALEQKGYNEESLLWAIPGLIKDNFAVQGHLMTCASRILEGFVSPYDAEVIKRLNKEQFINMGRVNMDEMAMGASGRYSCYGPTLNPLDKSRLVGGSSSGSAAAVAAGLAAFALGSDTGGSSRLPASYAGVCGFKCTYGAMPRSGLAALGPSLDTPGIIARTPADIAVVFNAIAGSSPMDESSIDISKEGLALCEEVNLKGMKIGRFSHLMEKARPSVVKAFNKMEQWLTEKGAVLEDVDLGVEDVLLKTYYAVVCSEAASSLSRLDGSRYGVKVDADTTDELFIKTRHDYFGKEVHRRILLGNYFLKQENYRAWYDKASHIRDVLREKVAELKQQGFQMFLLPGFHEAPPIDTPEEDNYASDLVGVFANLFGGPAIAVPAYYGENNLPVSFQFSAPQGNDALIIRVAEMWHKEFRKQ